MRFLNPPADLFTGFPLKFQGVILKARPGFEEGQKTRILGHEYPKYVVRNLVRIITFSVAAV